MATTHPTHPGRTRRDTLFDLRYAARVLELHAALWRRGAHALKLVSLASGATAIGGVLTAPPNAALATTLAAVFAAVQLVDAVLNPAGIAALSQAMRREYQRILARESTLSDAELESAYQMLVAEDEVHVPMRLRRLAYNHVVDELGLDPAEKFQTRAVWPMHWVC